MAEYIEREVVRTVVKDKATTKYDWSEEIDFEDFETVLDAIPAADVAPVGRGVWIGTADGYADGELVYDMWECSECGFDADGADEKPDWNYCPNCGARMDLKGD